MKNQIEKKYKAGSYSGDFEVLVKQTQSIAFTTTKTLTASQLKEAILGGKIDYDCYDSNDDCIQSIQSFDIKLLPK